MRKACCSAVRGGNVKRAATLVESPGNRFSDAGSIPAISTKQVLDEHLFLQRRLRREMFALIHNRKAPSWESDPEAALFLQLVKQMADAEGITETLKANDQMEWVGRMNSCRDRASETVYHQVIYTVRPHR